MRRRFAVVVAVAVAGWFISSPIASPSAHATMAVSETASTSAEVDASLNRLAQLLAVAVNDVGVRQQISSHISLGTDGMTNPVSYASLDASTDFTNQFGSAYSSVMGVAAGPAITEIQDLTEPLLPRLQVDVPVGFANWNPELYRPSVVSSPVGIDDSVAHSITGYNGKGTPVTYDGQATPVNPVIVLSLEEGPVEGELAPPSDAVIIDPYEGVDAPPDGEGFAPISTAATCYQARVSYVRLWDDQEPWHKGRAETRLVAKSNGIWYHDEFPYLEFDGDQYWPNELLGCTTNNVRFYWYENDSGAQDYTLGYNGFSFGIKLSDEDDLIGGRELTYSSFSGTSDSTTDFGELTMKTN